MNLTFNTLIKHETKSNIIPHTAFHEVCENLIKLGLKDLARIIRNSLGVWDDKSNYWTHWIADHKYNDYKYQGKWTRRFMKFCKTNNGIVVTEQAIAMIGEVLGKYQKDITMNFQVTNKFSWKAGDFGENENSCWWASYNYCRLGLSVSDYGYSVLFYKNEEQYNEHSGSKGIARCWMIKLDDRLFIFNAYGIPLSIIADALALQFNCKSRKVRVSSKNAYINMGNMDNDNGILGGGNVGIAYMLHNDDLSEEEKDSDYIYNLPEFSENMLSCCNCGHAKRATSREHIEYKDKLYCGNCYSDLFFTCACGNKHLKTEEGVSEMYNDSYGRKMFTCPSCTTKINNNKSKHTCINHGLSYKRVYKAWHTSRGYCGTCVAAGKLVVCENCQHRTDEYTKLKVSVNRTAVKLCKTCVGTIRKTLMKGMVFSNEHSN